MLRDDLLTRLGTLPPTPERAEYLRFVTDGGEAALSRGGGAEHVTASCFVLSEGLDRVLLCFHRKGGFWVQFGGHLEPGDATVADAARREAREESGLADLELAGTGIADLDRHELNAGFACAVHWDVGFLAFASPEAPLAVSEESLDLGWFGVQALPEPTPPGFPDRLQMIIEQAASRRP